MQIQKKIEDITFTPMTLFGEEMEVSENIVIHAAGGMLVQSVRKVVSSNLTIGIPITMQRLKSCKSVGDNVMENFSDLQFVKFLDGVSARSVWRL